MKDTQDSIDEIDALMKGRSENTTLEKILDKFVIIDQNLILKTDIENSKGFTALKTIEYDLKKKGLKRSAETIKTFCDWYIKVRVSHGRLSRKEILDAISAIKRENSTSTIGAKLFGFGNNGEKRNE